MIHYSNIQRLDNADFSEYLNMTGLSHSFLKGEKYGNAKVVLVSNKIMVGKIVDAILSDPQGMDMSSPLYPAAKTIAYEIKNKFGSIISNLKPQVSYSADLNFQGFRLSTRARLDWLLEKFAVIDLKITFSKDIKGLIKYMGYPNQVWHYSKCSGVEKAYIMIYSVPLDKTFLYEIPVHQDTNQFWETKILKFGSING